MKNILLKIDKEQGTEYALKIQEGSFMAFVLYIEHQFSNDYQRFLRLKDQFDHSKNGTTIMPINKKEIVKFLNHESTDIISAVIEYAVDFFTKGYKLSDFDEIKEKLITLTNQVNALAKYRHDNYKALINYLKI